MVRRVIGHMRSNLESRLTVNEMAEVARISPYHFNRTFSSLVGLPPGQFLGILRIQEAKLLLLDTPKNVTEVCHKVGFGSLGTFSRRFKSLVGLSPRNFRQLASMDFSSLSRAPRTWERPAVPTAVHGHVEGSPAFDGPLVVALFESPVPDCNPVACNLLSGPGPFVLHGVPDGTFHLLAAAMPDFVDARSSLITDEIARAGDPASPIRVHDGRVTGKTRLALRAPWPEDPPILMVSPPVLRLLDDGPLSPVVEPARRRSTRRAHDPLEDEDIAGSENRRPAGTS